MWMLFGGILAGLLLLLAVTAGEKIEADWKTEGMYRVFLRTSVCLNRRMRKQAEGKSGKRRYEKPKSEGQKYRVQKRSCEVSEDWILLYPSDAEKMQYRNRMEKISALFFFLAVGTVVALLMTVSGNQSRSMTEEGRVIRNDYGEGNLQLELDAKVGEAEETLRLEIAERRFTEAELERMLPEALALLEQRIIGENSSLDQVSKALELPTELEGYPFVLQWESGNYGVIRSDGQVSWGQVGETGELVSLAVILSYGEYVWEERFWVRVCRPQTESSLQQRLTERVKEQDEKAVHEESFLLPGDMEGEPIIWKERKTDHSTGIFLLFLSIGILQRYLPDQQIRKELEERDRQLKLAYPEFISKLTLLIGAGLPIRSALARMAEDYQEKKKRGTFSYIYEEILFACREMSGGVTEMQTYEKLGQRLRLPQYRKCMALLAAGQRKGASGLLAALQEEAANSFQERKHLAREEGERAGTKLLFPMMMTLAVVMVLILVPACFSFAGM